MKLINWIKGWRLWVKIVVPIALAALIAGGCYGTRAYLMYRRTRQLISVIQDTGTIGSITQDVQQTAEEYQGDVLNLLVVGIDYDDEATDRDYGSPDQAHTDVILYIHYNVKDNKVSILQIPRDSYVGDVTSTGKINQVFAEGANQQNHIVNLAKLINADFGLPVDKYITLDMAAFKEIVDVFGGLDVYLPWDIYTYDDNGNQQLLASAGKTRLNGNDAELVVRARKQYQQADLKRLELQQYIYAAMYKLIKSASLNDMYNYVLPIVSARVKSDLDFNTMCSLASKVLKLNGSDIYFVRVPGGAATAGDQSVYGVDAKALLPILNEHFQAEGEPDLTLAKMAIPTGWTYYSGEIVDEGRYLNDLLSEEAADSASQDSSSGSSAVSSAASRAGSSADSRG